MALDATESFVRRVIPNVEDTVDAYLQDGIETIEIIQDFYCPICRKRLVDLEKSCEPRRLYDSINTDYLVYTDSQMEAQVKGVFEYHGETFREPFDFNPDIYKLVVRASRRYCPTHSGFVTYLPFAEAKSTTSCRLDRYLYSMAMFRRAKETAEKVKILTYEGIKKTVLRVSGMMDDVVSEIFKIISPEQMYLHAVTIKGTKYYLLIDVEDMTVIDVSDSSVKNPFMWILSKHGIQHSPRQHLWVDLDEDVIDMVEAIPLEQRPHIYISKFSLIRSLKRVVTDSIPKKKIAVRRDIFLDNCSSYSIKQIKEYFEDSKEDRKKKFCRVLYLMIHDSSSRLNCNSMDNKDLEMIAGFAKELANDDKEYDLICENSRYILAGQNKRMTDKDGKYIEDDIYAIVNQLSDRFDNLKACQLKLTRTRIMYYDLFISDYLKNIDGSLGALYNALNSLDGNYSENRTIMWRYVANHYRIYAPMENKEKGVSRSQSDNYPEQNGSIWFAMYKDLRLLSSGIPRGSSDLQNWDLWRNVTDDWEKDIPGETWNGIPYYLLKSGTLMSSGQPLQTFLDRIRRLAIMDSI